MNANIYNIPFYIHKIRNRKIQKVRFKDIVLDKKAPNCKEEIRYKEISDSYLFLSQNIKSIIDANLFIKSYFLLTNKRISNKKAIKFVSIWYQYKECNIIEFLTFLLEEINKEIKYRKLEFTLLIVNYFFNKIENKEIIIYQSMFNELKNIFKSKENTISTLLMLKKSQNLNQINHSNYLLKDDIINYFQSNRTYLKSKFMIKRLFLFGSYSEHTHHAKSDLDLLVIFNDSITSFDKIALIKQLKEYLEKYLKLSVDVINFEYAIASMDFMSLNKILTIY